MSGPDATKNLRGGGKLIFQDLYVYIFCCIEIFCSIYECILFVKQWKSKKIDLFFARACDKKGCLEGIARKREKIL